MDDAQTDAPKYEFFGATRLPLSVVEIISLRNLSRHSLIAEVGDNDFSFAIGVREFRRLLDSHETLRAALASPRAPASHAGDPFESPAHAVARLSDEVRAPSRSPLRAQVEALRERHIERCPHAGVHASGLDCVCGASGFNRALNAVLALLDTASPSPDWRDSEAVKKLYDIVRLAATREDTDLLVDVWLPKLCDAVQSHARPSKDSKGEAT